jgi:hypothetical protein
MTDIMRFMEYIGSMHVIVYNLARPVIHGKVGLHEIAMANDCLRKYPELALSYDFICVLAGGVVGEFAALVDEARRELVADFYAWKDDP